MIGKIRRVPLAEVWKHEAHDFTKWLEGNIDVVNDAIDLNLSGVEREKSAGKFSVDLVAEDESGNPVVIENQLEKSDHDHLGKLITYLTAIEAKAAIWIVSDPRPEHVGAITWLNEASSAAFYLLKLEAIKIGDSTPAPQLTLIVGPSDEAKVVGHTKKDFAERHGIRHRFWNSLLERAKTRTRLHAAIAPRQDTWIGTSTGGLGYNYAVRKNSGKVELYIDRGEGLGDENKSIFDALYAQKDAIEATFGGSLEWERLETKRACRITKELATGGYRDEEDKWPEIQDQMIDAMIRLEKALAPHIKALKVMG